MGYLTYGAIAGATGEYLKQSEEGREEKREIAKDERQHNYQMIRDKRLSGLRMEESTHEQGLIGAREGAQRDYDKKNYSFGYGENVVRDGKVVHTGGDRPTSDGKQQGNLITLKTGDQVTYEELRKSYADIIRGNRDEFGNPIGDFEEPTWDEWWNSQVNERHQRDLPKPPPPPEPTPDEPGFFDKLQTWIAGSDNEAVADDRAFNKEKKRGGMLSEDGDEKPRKKQKLKQPLSRAAQQDPVQMYDELMAQFSDSPDVGEQDIIDTIRSYFGMTDWQPPADALK